MSRNLAGVSTPVTQSGLRQFDRLSAAEAVRRAWSERGSHPRWDADVEETIRQLNPVLARALDRLADKQSF